ncbi:MAG: cation-translocating P-type ATPase [Burkholderiaceae bacterium]|nr:cation-translocating P-type ATPase [Burkholderiaceae bacterium]
MAERLQVHPEQGLQDPDIAARRARHGENLLPEARPAGWGRRLLDAFGDFMILVLLAAAAVAWAMGERSDALVILVIIGLNAAIGLLQQWRAERALAALRSLATPMAMVRRDGRTQPLPAQALVPGDVVLLEAGNLVPADLRLHDSAQLRVDEAMLTGESVPVDKQTAALPPHADGEHPLGDRFNLAYRGTLVTHGRGEGVVVATGTATQLGRVAALLDTSSRRDTPLQRRLAAFGKRLSLVVLGICLLLFLAGLARGEPPLLMALTAISLAVAAIPEALPAVVAVLLALGARRMAQVNALVKRLPAVETLGSVSTICSDKTGTLTLNRMRVAEVHLGAQDATGRTAAAALWRSVALCNDAQPRADASAAPQEPEHWIGDPTETALLAAAAATGRFDLAALRARLPRRHEWPFDAARKRMSTLHPRHQGDGWLLLCKGAPESLLPRCRHFPPAPQGAPGRADEPLVAWLAHAQALAAQGLRVLAFAQRRWPGDLDEATLRGLDAEAAEQELELLGLIGLIDPPRPEAAQAVAQCLQAGIRPVMITGDHPATALAIARQLGIVGTAGSDDAAAAHERALVLTGAEIARMDDTQLAALAASCRVYARVDPAQKVRIVTALQAGGDYVAMTGDGVNDAPALQRADIGVAMGRNGTDVAREAAALVLLDDRFASIVAAVREGRRIFDNIRKFVRYTMTSNSGEIWVLALAPVLGMPMALLPIHILWINLVTDGLPGLALAAEPAEPGVMRRPPRAPQESLFAQGLWQHCLFVGLLMGGLCLGVQAWALSQQHPGWQTMVFCALTFAQMGHVLVIRSESQPLWQLGLGSNRPLLAAVALTLLLQLAVVYLPPLQAIFHTQALALADLALCFACAAVLMLAVEAEKHWRQRRRG